MTAFKCAACGSFDLGKIACRRCGSEDVAEAPLWGSCSCGGSVPEPLDEGDTPRCEECGREAK